MHKIESTGNMVFSRCDDHLIQGHVKKEKCIISTVPKEDWHMLNISPQGEWESITIQSDSGYYNQALIWDNPDGFSEEVPEGKYNVLISGWIDDLCFLSVYDFQIVEDYVFTPSPSEDAAYSINVHGLDENGLEMSDKYVNLMWYDIYLTWPGGVEVMWMLSNEHDGAFYNDLQNFRFNELNEDCRVSTHSVVFVDEQTAYYIEYPSLLGKVNESPRLENDYTAFSVSSNYFSINKTEESTYYLDYYQYMNDYWFRTIGYDEVLCYDPQVPYKVISNIMVKTPTIYEKGEIKTKLMPCALQSYPSFDFFEEKIIAPGMYNNEENLLVAEPFDIFEQMNFKFHESGYPIFQPTPIAEKTIGRNTFYYGERTPILYYQSQGYDETSSPYGLSFFSGQMLFIGENGCQRINDENANLTVLINGEEVFYDSMYYFNWYENFYMPEETCWVSMDIVNENCVIDNIVKKNHTSINFDLNEIDAMPPTMTVLQVVDSEDTEMVFLPDYQNSKIRFAAGDFSCHIDEILGIDHMQYSAKPSVEVFYGIANGDWMPFDCTENEDLFHVNYGNVFTIELSQLDESVLNQWVNLKFVVTDEAGNSQVQELSNVFYVGQQTSVNEATTLTHTVYPNPFTHEVRINAAEAVNGNASINVFNVLGEQVISKAMNCNETTEFVIDGSSLNAGIYFYSIATENGTLQGRIVKE